MKLGKLRIGQLIVLLASACGLHGQDFDKMVEGLLDGSVALIQSDSLYKLKEKTPSLVILDAREKEEFDVSHIAGAQWVGYKDFEMSDIKINKDQQVVVYCSVGYRSEKIGEEFQEAGFKNVKNLYGGIFAWKNAGLPIVDESGTETERIHAYSKSWGKWLTKGEKIYE